MAEIQVHKKHPFTFVLGLEFIVLIVDIISLGITKMLGLDIYANIAIGNSVLTIITVFILWKMNWWKIIGFRTLRTKYFYLLIVPALPMIGNAFGHYSNLDAHLYFYYLLLTIMVGFVEEGIYRGLMLQVLLTKGVWMAVIATSVLFSLTHCMNLMSGIPWEWVLQSLVFAFVLGFGWAAFAIRTKTIWPLMLLHCIVDYLKLIQTEDLIKFMQSNKPGMETAIGTVIVAIVFIIYGVEVIESIAKNESNVQAIAESQSLIAVDKGTKPAVDL